MTDQKLQRAAYHWELRYLCQLGLTALLTDREEKRVERLLRLLKIGPETQLMRRAVNALGWSR